MQVLNYGADSLRRSHSPVRHKQYTTMKKSNKIGAVLYVRGSDEQSLEDQEAFLRDYCDNNEFKVLRVLREEDVSAITAITKVIRSYFKNNDAIALVTLVDVTLTDDNFIDAARVLGCACPSNATDTTEKVSAMMSLLEELGGNEMTMSGQRHWKIQKGIKCLQRLVYAFGSRTDRRV